MSIKLHWFLPTTGDARGLVGGGHSVPQGVGRPATIGTANQFRDADIEYLADDRPHRRAARLRGRAHPDGHLVRGRLAGHGGADPARPRTLKFLVAFRPGVTSPTLSAQMAAAFQRISRGRLLLNVVTGGEPTEQTRFGDHLGHGRALRPHRRVPLGRARARGPRRRSTSTAKYYQVEGAEIRGTIDPVPDIYFGGSSGPAGPVAAKHADVYLTWGEPPEQVAREGRVDPRRWPRRRAARCGSGAFAT